MSPESDIKTIKPLQTASKASEETTGRMGQKWSNEFPDSPRAR